MTPNELNLLPDSHGCVVILSGGMDSTIAMRFAVEKYGSENVYALTFNYGQKQSEEINKARESTALLGVTHKVINAPFLGDISMGFSANVDTNIDMPTGEDVKGTDTPITYVPNRNMILLSIAAAYAETKGLEYILTGLQMQDSYGYWDTTLSFVNKMNAVFAENRKIKPKLIAPFVNMSKTDELVALLQLDGNLDLLNHTLTCYNPNEKGESCSDCPSCTERLDAFREVGRLDPIPYFRAVLVTGEVIDK